MVNTERIGVCQQYAIDHLSKIQYQLDRCHEEINQQVQTWSTFEASLSLNELDDYLKQYARIQQNYLLERYEKELFRYKADICDQKLYQQLRMAAMNITIQSLFEKLVQLRDLQFEIYEDWVMFKERIREKFLPLSFDQMENYVMPSFYWPSMEDQTLVETRIKCRKILQQMKRNILNQYMFAYEFIMNTYQQQYQQLLNELEMKLANSRIRMNEESLFNSIQIFINARTNRKKEEIFHKMISFRQVLGQRRQRASYSKQSVDVAPRVTVDVLHHTLDDDELDYLSQGKHSIARVLHKNRQFNCHHR